MINPFKHSSKSKFMNPKLAIILIIIGAGMSGIVYASSTVISDSGIITPSITVSGTCTGCTNNPSFSSYNTIALNETLAGSENTAIPQMSISNSGNVILANLHQNIFVTLTGSILFVHNNNDNVYSGLGVLSQSSEGGNYTISTNTANSQIQVTKNNSLLQNLGFKVSQCNVSGINTLGLAISPNGKYIALACADTGGALDRLVIFQGS